MAQTFGPFCSPTTVAPKPVPVCPACNAPGDVKPDTNQEQGSPLPGERKKDCGKKSPVYVATGVYEARYTDLQLPTVGFPLFVGRYYSTGHLIDGPTGIGWSSSFHARLHEATYLYAAPSTYQRRAEVIMPDGAHLEYVDDGTGHFTPPIGRYDVLVRNIDGTFDLTLQRSRSVMHFNGDGTLASIADDYGNALNYTYDAPTSRLQRVSDAAGSGRYLDITWGPNGRISAIQDNSGRSVQYAYNTDGTLASSTNAAAQTTTFTYATGRFGPMLSQIKDHWSRVITDLTWDAQGRLNTYTENGETYTYGYNNVVANRTIKTDAAGNLWVHIANASGIVTESDPPQGNGGAPTTSTYNTDGTLQLTTDEVGVKTLYTYTTQGRVASVTKDYQGPTTVRFDYTYDATFPEKVTSVIPKNPTTGNYDPNWQGWQYDYWPPGSAAPGALYHVKRLRTDGFTADTLATYTYNARGQILTDTNATGAVTDFGYDSAGNLMSITKPSNNDSGTRSATSYGYDSVGRVASVLDPLGKTTTYTHDPLDRVNVITSPPPTPSSILRFVTTRSYDNYDAPRGLAMCQTTDPNGLINERGYDQFGRLRRVIDKLGQTTTYSYTRDMLTGITDANNNTTTYQYNALKRLTATVFPNGAQETYAYYADGLLQTKTDRKNRTFTYVYDNQKRITRKIYPNATYIQYTYVGETLSQAFDTNVSPPETHSFTYDDRLRLSSSTQATRAVLSYTYNDADRKATTALANGPTTTYVYYPNGSINTIAWSPVTGVFKYSYDARGQYQRVTFPNGQTRACSYDDQGRLVQLSNTHPVSGNLAIFTYEYDIDHGSNAHSRLGVRTAVTADVPNQGWSGAVTTYNYDDAYQLTGVTYPNASPFAGETSSWTYDAIGNRTSSVTNGTASVYSYQKIGTNPLNSQRLLTAGATSFASDANENTTALSGYTLGFDDDNRLINVAGNTTANYTYDFVGRRTSKTMSTTTAYEYDEWNVVRETGASTVDYLFGPGVDEPLAMSGGGAISYYAIDGLRSVELVNDANGLVEDAYAYDAWGNTRQLVETVPQSFRFTAREAGEINTIFNRERFMNPSSGRFLSEDSTRFGAGMNFFAYTLNKPTMWTDPFGLNATASGPCPDDDPCGALRRVIEQIVRDLAKGAQDIFTNNYNEDPLPEYGPSDSVESHLETWRGYKRGLRRKIREWNDNHCGGLPEGAEEWQNAPDPSPLPSQNSPGPQRSWQPPSLPSAPPWVAPVVAGAAVATCLVFQVECIGLMLAF